MGFVTVNAIYCLAVVLSHFFFSVFTLYFMSAESLVFFVLFFIAPRLQVFWSDQNVAVTGITIS